MNEERFVKRGTQSSRECTLWPANRLRLLQQPQCQENFTDFFSLALTLLRSEENQKAVYMGQDCTPSLSNSIPSSIRPIPSSISPNRSWIWQWMKWQVKWMMGEICFPVISNIFYHFSLERDRGKDGPTDLRTGPIIVALRAYLKKRATERQTKKESWRELSGIERKTNAWDEILSLQTAFACNLCQSQENDCSLFTSLDLESKIERKRAIVWNWKEQFWKSVFWG